MTGNAIKGGSDIDTRKAAIRAAKAADSKKAIDIMVQDVGPSLGVTDYFVIATAQNPRQVDAIIEEVEDELRDGFGMKPLNRELSSDGSWSLLDYGPIVVHVFMPESRDYYRLELLWNDADVIDLSAEDGFDNLVYSDRIAALLDSAKASGDAGVAEDAEAE